MIVLILAGGGGARLWPLSRENLPKQFLSFGEAPSFLQKTVLRFINYSSLNKIIISTSDHYRLLVEEQISSLHLNKTCDIISEPLRKNTAPALAYSFRYLEETYQISSDEPILVVPADHFIEPESIFHDYLDRAQSLVSSKIVVFAVAASKPEIGYGYIEIEEAYNSYSNKITKFIEKPNLEQAKIYINSGRHYWNSGIFLFSANVFWNQLQAHAPEIYEIAKKDVKSLRDSYHLFPDISIDYALMEKTSEIVACRLELDWSDIGSWDSVYESLKKDEDQNILVGNVKTFETYNSLVIGSGKKIISTINLSDLLIIDTKDALLISKRGDSQKVKKVFFELIANANRDK